jgi:hypothetical protein
MTTMTNRNAHSFLPGLSYAPVLYTAELAEGVLQQLRDGRRLPDVCRDEGMPAPEDIRRWVLDDPEDFALHYFRARKIGIVARLTNLLRLIYGNRTKPSVRRDSAKRHRVTKTMDSRTRGLGSKRSHAASPESTGRPAKRTKRS